MKIQPLIRLLTVALAASLLSGCSGLKSSPTQKETTAIHAPVSQPSLPRLDGFFYETASGRTPLPPTQFEKTPGGESQAEVNMPDGRTVKISVKPQGHDFSLSLSAKPDADIVKWGLTAEAAPDEYFTGLMERVVDGPQTNSWDRASPKP